MKTKTILRTVLEEREDVVVTNYTQVRIYLQELRSEATRQGLDLQEESVQQRSM